jgi:hypothetical protein
LKSPGRYLACSNSRGKVTGMSANSADLTLRTYDGRCTDRVKGFPVPAFVGDRNRCRTA